jgi:3-deoxy-D-manno-octulosonic-acid transferase
VTLFLYNLFLLLSFPFLSVLLLAPRHRHGLRARFGFPPRAPADGRRTVWFHAVSVGEVMAAAPLVEAYRARWPSDRIVVTTVTATGQQVARSNLGSADLITYFPFDFPWSVAWSIDRLAPSCVVLLETEIWPNFLRAVRRRLIPVVLVNGRISDRSFRRYRKAAFFLRSIFDLPCRFSMQTELDAERIIRLGAPRERVRVAGNVKFDRATAGRSASGGRLKTIVDALGKPVLLAGSTHAGEEEIVLAAWDRVRRTVPGLRLVLAPRHPERVPSVENLARRMGLAVRRWSDVREGGAIPPEAFILVDTVGELAGLYEAADVSFVGGSLVPAGGHNLLEPAGAGSPILVGPHTENFREISDLLIAAGAARVIGSDGLAVALEELLQDETKRRAMGEAGRGVVERNAGATARTIDLLGELIGEPA